MRLVGMCLLFMLFWLTVCCYSWARLAGQDRHGGHE